VDERAIRGRRETADGRDGVGDGEESAIVGVAVRDDDRIVAGTAARSDEGLNRGVAVEMRAEVRDDGKGQLMNTGADEEVVKMVDLGHRGRQLPLKVADVVDVGAESKKVSDRIGLGVDVRG
jgi:hypothetical protein